MEWGGIRRDFEMFLGLENIMNGLITQESATWLESKKSGTCKTAEEWLTNQIRLPFT